MEKLLNAQPKDVERGDLKALGIPESDQNQRMLVAVGLLNRAKMLGDVKAFEKIQELSNEQTNALLELKKQELALKQRELELKEKELELKLNQGVSDDKVVIVNDLEDIDESN